ncbi:C39 family peptidase [[Clostridium] innocuum]|nr:C39 family peptidase [[Clostridium] innocuum]
MNNQKKYVAAIVLSATFFIFYGNDHINAKEEDSIEVLWYQDDYGKYCIDENGARTYGWITVDDKIYYIGDNGYAVSGVVSIGEHQFLFGEDCILRIGRNEYNDQLYYSNELGIIQKQNDNSLSSFPVAIPNGWQKKAGKTFYYKDGLPLKGLQQIEGSFYYFEWNGEMKTGWQYPDNKIYYFAADGKMIKGWFTVGNNRYHQTEKGIALGLTEIDNNIYCFNSEGVLQSGKYKAWDKTYFLTDDGRIQYGWLNYGSSRYYLYNGYAVRGNQYIDNKLYLFNDEGKLLTGLNRRSGDLYYSTANGVLTNAWIEESGFKYYFDGKGKALRGIQKVENQYYYFEWTNEMKTGRRYQDGKMYYFGESGEMLLGWFNVDGHRYYQTPSGIATGLEEILDETYCFDSIGELQRGWYDFNGKTYYLADDGRIQYGWINIGIPRFYLQNGYIVYGIQNIGNQIYAFDNNAELIRGLGRVNGDLYYGTTEGVVTEKWIHEIGNRYYFDKFGKAVRGIKKINDNTYYFEWTGEMKTGWQYPNEKMYYFGNSGEMLLGWFNLNNERYFQLSDGIATGLIKIGNETYCFNSTGILQKGWYDAWGKTYYLTNDGRIQYGWINIGTSRFYLENGYILYGIKIIEGKKYAFNNNAELIKGLGRINGELYYGTVNGVKTNAWIDELGNRYYFNGDGKAVTYTQNINNKIYYFNRDGSMHRGWKDLNGKTYYYDIQNGVLAIGKIQINRRTFTFDSVTGEFVRMQAKIPYYNQASPEWGTRKYGDFSFASSGCVPTSIAMVFSFIKDQTIKPTEIAKWSYNKGYFNHNSIGAGGSIMAPISNQYGISSYSNLNFNKVKKDLQQGKLVIAFMDSGTFAPSGTTHAIVLYGIDNNNYVDVYDPLYKEHNKKYSLSLILSEKSKSKYDNVAGGPIFSFY